MKYAVAYMSYFENDLKIIIIEANNPITAMIEGAYILMNEQEAGEWLNDFLKEYTHPNDYEKRIEEIKEDFYDADQAIAITPIL